MAADSPPYIWRNSLEIRLWEVMYEKYTMKIFSKIHNALTFEGKMKVYGLLTIIIFFGGFYLMIFFGGIYLIPVEAQKVVGRIMQVGVWIVLAFVIRYIWREDFAEKWKESQEETNAERKRLGLPPMSWRNLWGILDRRAAKEARKRLKL